MERLEALAIEVDSDIAEISQEIEANAYINHKKILEKFVESGISDYHLKGSTGYGYNDSARDKLEEIYAGVFGSQAALVRSQIVSGTHAIALCLYGVLRPGDELLSVVGLPYDSLHGMIGINSCESGSLKDFGVSYRQVDLLNGQLDFDSIAEAINSKTRLIYVQRSRGYSIRPSLNIEQLSKLVKFIRDIKRDLLVFVDNCYGEFVESREPIEIGADLVAGSLIKNPGGGLAPSGGYVAGREDLVEMAAARWTAPGVGAEIGPSPDFVRLLFQGLFLAPRTVAESLHSAVFAARLFEKLGYQTFPAYNEKRTDIIQTILLGSEDKLVKFCKGIQSASPVDSGASPIPSDMPGYDNKVIMAAGCFIQGASIELSADAPIREPYAVYLQGGMSRHYTRIAVLNAALHVHK
jgi:cystathionine beta-lyase family protein involved in aluminum resistance